MLITFFFPLKGQPFKREFCWEAHTTEQQIVCFQYVLCIVY